jgi:predicted DCC family thiol-disulfide oxidoreductase YuxK
MSSTMKRWASWVTQTAPPVSAAQRPDSAAEARLSDIPASAAKLTVWFDGICPLCQREVALMRRQDRNGAINFVDVTKAKDESCQLDRAELLARFHACENGKMLSGAAAFGAMWRAVPLLKPIGQLARLPLVLRLLERVYSVFLLFRPHLQRLLRPRS